MANGNSMDGKVALVSGSGRGIGRAIAEKLGRNGAAVVVNDLDEDIAGETIAAIEAAGGKATACIGDVTTPDFGERFANTAVETFGGIDIVVNNAGYAWDSVIQKTTDEQFLAMLDVHVVAPFRILRAASEYIRATAKEEIAAGKTVYRKVVNISSIAGLYGAAGQIGYSAGKSALVGMTRTLAKEWGRYNVNVNCVAFGFIHTRMTQPLGDEQAVAKIGNREIGMGIHPNMIKTLEAMVPLGRGGTPEEAADTVYMFCSKEANYVSGQVVLAGGGLII